ncbi:MAG: transcription termination/antitermination protein NusA [Lachnospiraceae bacterium]|nr:transcription termination/antitermination protein NusA [Lachnospiraceae bacterium]
MNKELMEALDMLEKEKEISKETLFDAIENSLITACKNHFGKADNIKVEIDRDTCDFLCYAEKEVVEEVEDDCLQISLDDAKELSIKAKLGDMLHVEIKSKEFGRIATQNAKNVILQKIREEERSVIYNQYYEKEKDVVTGIVQRYMGRNISINLGKTDAVLNESEQVRGENFKPTERIKVYILEVKNTPKGPRILVSRTHPELVKRLFETEVTEIKDGTVEIMSIAREAGSRTKIAVHSNNPNVDAVGACVGINGARVNSIVEELRGEKIDIVNWDDNPGNLIQNALSPAKIVAVFADPDEKTAKVVVPDYQLSLAIGKEGQNARLAARLTGYKIDIKSETQAKDAPGFRYEDYDYDEEEYDEEDYDEVDYNEEEEGYETEGGEAYDEVPGQESEPGAEEGFEE